MVLGYQYRFRQCVVDPRVEVCFSVDCLVVAELRVKLELDLAQSRFCRWKIDLRQQHTQWKLKVICRGYLAETDI